MGEDPGAIREEIEATRDRMSETADALAAKADVRSRLQEKATVARTAALEKAREVRENPGPPAAAAGGLAALVTLVAVVRGWRRRRSARKAPRYYTRTEGRQPGRTRGRRQRVITVYRAR